MRVISKRLLVVATFATTTLVWCLVAPSALANHDVDVIEHVTIGPAGGNTPNYDAGLWGISADGGKAWINTW